jgi:hypothetical protein
VLECTHGGLRVSGSTGIDSYSHPPSSKFHLRWRAKEQRGSCSPNMHGNVAVCGAWAGDVLFPWLAKHSPELSLSLSEHPS